MGSEGLGFESLLENNDDKPAGYFWLMKGRVALYAALKALGVGKGDRVALTGYTCVVVPAAICYLGAEPVYIDIDEATYNIDRQCLNSSELDGVKAIIIQYSYGISSGLLSVIEWAKERGIKIIEDCCHVLGSTVNQKPCGMMGDAAFFSFQWNKPITSGLGGLLVMSHPKDAKVVEKLIQNESIQLGFLDRSRLMMEYLAYTAFFSPKNAMFLTRAYRWCTENRILTGSSQSGELLGEMPSRYFLEMSHFQKQVIARKMTKLHKIIQHRRKIADEYQRLLSEYEFPVLNPEFLSESVLLRYPVQVKNREILLKKALRETVEIGSWFESPLHPISCENNPWNYQIGSCPVGERISSTIINLPIHMGMDLVEVKRHCDFIFRYAEPIL